MWWVGCSRVGGREAGGCAQGRVAVPLLDSYSSLSFYWSQLAGIEERSTASKAGGRFVEFISVDQCKVRQGRECMLKSESGGAVGGAGRKGWRLHCFSAFAAGKQS